MKWPLIFFLAAVGAAILGFSGIAEAFANIAIILFLVFGFLFLLSVVFGRAGHTMHGIVGGVGGVLTLAAVAFTAVWLSDRYSLEEAGASLDQTLADARQNLDEVVDDLPGAARDAREEIAEALDDAGEAVEPEGESRVE